MLLRTNDWAILNIAGGISLERAPSGQLIAGLDAREEEF
jgi:hypothetical protein